jgi:hypothetical protein
VHLYQSLSSATVGNPVASNPASRPGRGTVRISSLRPEQHLFAPNVPKAFQIRILTNDSFEAPFYLALVVFDQNHKQLLIIDSHHSDTILIPGAPIQLNISLRSPWLCPGQYRVDAFLYNFDSIDTWEDACRFGVSSEMPYPGAIDESAVRGSVVLPEFTISNDLGVNR